MITIELSDSEGDEDQRVLSDLPEEQGDDGEVPTLVEESHPTVEAPAPSVNAR